MFKTFTSFCFILCTVIFVEIKWDFVPSLGNIWLNKGTERTIVTIRKITSNDFVLFLVSRYVPSLQFVTWKSLWTFLKWSFPLLRYVATVSCTQIWDILYSDNTPENIFAKVISLQKWINIIYCRTVTWKLEMKHVGVHCTAAVDKVTFIDVD